MPDFLRGTGTPSLDARILSWESTTPEKDSDKQLEDRPRPKRISRRWSREIPRATPQRRQKSTLGFLASWKIEEYDDEEQEDPEPPQQTTVKEDAHDRTPWQNAHVPNKLTLNLREIVSAGLDRRRSSSSDDTSNTPWDAPSSPSKTPTTSSEVPQSISQSPQPKESQAQPLSVRSSRSDVTQPAARSPRTQNSEILPTTPKTSQSGKQQQLQPLSLSPVSQDDKAGESEEVVHFSSISESSLPPETDCGGAAVFKVQPVTQPAFQERRVSTAGAPATAEELIRRASGKSSAWERIFDGVPRSCRNKWSNAVIGATSRTDAPPSAKHIRTVLDGLREGGSPSDRCTPVGAVLFTLRDRIEMPQWTVRLKTAVFCHTVFRAGNQKFVEYVGRAHGDLFDSEAFTAGEAFASCEQGIAHKAFASEYATYLQKWLAMKATAKFPTGRTDASSARRFKSASHADLLSSLPRLLDTLERVSPLELYPEIEESSLGDSAISLVLRDSRTLLSALDAGVKRLVALFFGLPDRSAVRAMAVYARYVRVVKEVRPVLGRMRGEGSVWMQGTGMTACLVGRMQTYIENGCKSKNPPTIKLSPVGEGAKRKGEEVDAIRRKSEIARAEENQLTIKSAKAVQDENELPMKADGNELLKHTEEPSSQRPDEEPREANSNSSQDAVDTTAVEIFDSETQKTEIVRPLELDEHFQAVDETGSMEIFDSETQETEIVRPLELDEDLSFGTEQSLELQTNSSDSEQSEKKSEEEDKRELPDTAVPFPLRSRYPSDEEM